MAATPKYRKSTLRDVDSIHTMIKNEAHESGAVVAVRRSTIRKWIRDGLSFVATIDGKIIGHEGANMWKKSKCLEMRSAIVLKQYRGLHIGNGINTHLIGHLRKNYRGWRAIAFVNSAAKSRGMLQREGFVKIDNAELPQEFFLENGAALTAQEHGYETFTEIL